ncbi:MAG: hypothetical protein DMF65_11800 [Acidobacteria bacterium]|nr:MAG: hypothetical protein DMF65_11800 [Acidobacteriota bacterium]
MKERNLFSAIKMVSAGALVVCAAASVFSQTASTTYRGARQDPFTKYKPRLVHKVEKRLMPVPVPPIQARIDNYKAQKLAAMNLQQSAPKPTMALTLSEVQVIGIFRTPRGYAAMVEATPIGLSYVVYPGERFYDGMLVAIEENRLVFRRQTRWTDGHTEVAVETKPLRQANAVADSLTEQRTASSAGGGATPAPGSSGGSSELNVLVEALKALAASANAQQQQQQSQGEQSNGKP